MMQQLSKTERAIVAGSLLLGSVLAVHGQMQKPVFVVNDKVVAVQTGKGTEFALFNKDDAKECIGLFDAAAANLGKTPFTPATLDNFQEVKEILDASTVAVGDKTMYNVMKGGIYHGAPLHLGECNVGQATQNFATSPGSTTASAPAAGGYANDKAAFDARMNATMNSVRLTWKIVKAEPKQAVIQISDSKNVYTMKIEHGSTFAALKSMTRNADGRGDYSGSTGNLSGKDIKLSIDGSVARWYKPDGTPEDARESKQLAGLTTTGIMRMWNSDDLTRMGNELVEKAKAGSGGTDPEYVNVARGLGNKGVIPSAFSPNTPPPGSTN